MSLLRTSLLVAIPMCLLSSIAQASDPPPRKRECSTDADCSTGACNGFTCILGACSTSADCAEDQLCDLRDDPCAAYQHYPEAERPERCVIKQGTKNKTGSCQPFGDSCKADAECGPYELCVISRRFQCAEGDQRCSTHSRAECTRHHFECGLLEWCSVGSVCGVGNRCVPKEHAQLAERIQRDPAKQALIEALPRDTSGRRPLPSAPVKATTPKKTSNGDGQPSPPTAPSSQPSPSRSP